MSSGCKNSLGFILLLLLSCIISRCNSQQNNNEVRNILRTLTESISTLGENLKRDLDESFRKLSSQLEGNGRQLTKTLSIFENEWKEKAARLTALEDRQRGAETSIMKLNEVVHEMKKSQNQFINQVHASTPAPPPPPYAPRTPNSVTQAYIENYEEEEDGDGRRPNGNQTPMDESEEKLNFDSHSEVIFVDPIAEVQNDASYHVIGTPDSFKTLEAIPASEQSELSSIELHYVNVDPEVLKSSLQNCTKLRSLKLLQVRFEAALTNDTRVLLPNLEEFLLDQVGVLTFRNDTIFSKWTEVDELLKGVDKTLLKTLIFFDKNAVQPWEIERVTSLGTNIEIRIDGVRIFVMNYEEGQLSSMLKYTNDFLKYLDPSFLLKKVAISAWRLDLALLPDSITHLNVNYVLDTNEHNLSKKLQQFRNLQELNIFIGNQRDFGWSLSSIPQLQLKNLTIRYSDIRDFPTNKLLRLDRLYFHLCHIDLPFVQTFPRVFETIQMGVTFRRDNGIPIHHPFLARILSTPVQLIFMQNFDRNLTRVGTHSDVSGMEQFLSRVGIRKGVEHFILKNRNGTWYGRGLDPMELALQTLQWVGTDQFVTLDAYRTIIQ